MHTNVPRHPGAGPARTGPLHAEWTKLRTVPSTWWLMLATVVGTVALTAAWIASVDTSQCPSPRECFEDTARLTVGGVRLGQIGVVVLAVLAVTNEYASRMITTTLAAAPRRLALLAAKVSVVLGAVLVTGVVAVAGSFALGRAMLPGRGFNTGNGYAAPSLADEPTLRAVVGTVLYLSLVALLSMGVGTALRDTASSITVVLCLLYALPIVASLVSDPRWQERLSEAAPMTAGLAIQVTTGLGLQPIGPWQGLGVLALYAGGALLLGAARFTMRDA